jgi:hypothetical protein
MASELISSLPRLGSPNMFWQCHVVKGWPFHSRAECGNGVGGSRLKSRQTPPHLDFPGLFLLVGYGYVHNNGFRCIAMIIRPMSFSFSHARNQPGTMSLLPFVEELMRV